jgi:threonine/homoserine/homoserine lactone efflux protein
MPAPSTLALFALAALALIAIPGPNMLYVAMLGAILGALGFAMDCGYAIAAGAAAKRLGGFRHGRRVTGAVYLALGAAAALTGGRR